MDTIEEEDETSQRRSQPQSQLNTITTYDTDNEGNANELNKDFSINKFSNEIVQNPTFTKTQPDSWDRNYYYNNYSRPFAPYESINKAASAKMKHWLLGNSIRYLILFLSTCAISSIIANFLLYNSIIIYSRNPTGPKFDASVNLTIGDVFLGAFKGRFSSDAHQINQSGDTNNSAVDSSSVSKNNDITIVLQNSPPIELFYDGIPPSQRKDASSNYRHQQQINPSSSIDINSSSVSNADTNNIRNARSISEELDNAAIQQENYYSNASSSSPSISHSSSQPSNNSVPLRRAGLFTRFLERNLLFAVPGLTFFISFIPASLLLHHIGSYKIVSTSLLLSGFITIVFPFFIGQSIWLVVLLRSVLGVLSSTVISFIVENTSNWATIKEQLIFFAIGYLAFQVGPAISYPLTGLFGIDPIGLVRLFGAHSAATLFVTILWVVFYRNNPQKHFLVSAIELNRIITGKSKFNRLLEERNEKILNKFTTASTLFAIFFGTSHFVATPILIALLPARYWTWVYFGVIAFLILWIAVFVVIKIFEGATKIPSGDEFTLLYSTNTTAGDPDVLGQIPNVVLINTRNLDPSIQPL